MDSNTTLRLTYAGGLGYYQPSVAESSALKAIKNWFWTYSIDNIDKRTRSGYFLFKAVQKLKSDYNIGPLDLEIELWGAIEPGNKTQIKELGIDDIVTITGQINKTVSREKLQNSDIVFLPLETSKENQRSLFIPGKLYEYLSLQKPILALGENSDAVDILQQSGLGIILNPNDTNKIADTLYKIIKDKNILKNYSANTEYINSNFSFVNLTKKLCNVFDELSDK